MSCNMLCCIVFDLPKRFKRRPQKLDDGDDPNADGAYAGRVTTGGSDDQGEQQGCRGGLDTTTPIMNLSGLDTGACFIIVM